MSHIFPNSRQKLLGDSEDSIGIIDVSATAGLSGDVSNDIDVQLFLESMESTGQVAVFGLDKIYAEFLTDWKKK